MCARLGLEGAVVSQNEDSTVKVVLLGGTGKFKYVFEDQKIRVKLRVSIKLRVKQRVKLRVTKMIKKLRVKLRDKLRVINT